MCLTVLNCVIVSAVTHDLHFSGILTHGAAAVGDARRAADGIAKLRARLARRVGAVPKRRARLPRTRDVFLGALKTERDALVQRVLLSFFFMKMKDDPSLAGAMIEILNDPAHPKRMRDQACQNLEVIGRPTRAVRKAIEEYKKGRAGGGAERAPQEVF